MTGALTAALRDLEPLRCEHCRADSLYWMLLPRQLRAAHADYGWQCVTCHCDWTRHGEFQTPGKYCSVGLSLAALENMS